MHNQKKKIIFSLMDKRKVNMMQPGKRPRIDSGLIPRLY